MKWILVINDVNCKKELAQFIAKNKHSIVLKTEASKFETNSSLLVVNSANEINIVISNDIVRCTSHQNYTELHLSNGKKILATKSLKKMETLLKDHLFTRVHHSHLVNIKYISKYLKTSGHVVLNDGTKIPVAARKKENFLVELENL
jgi:two-component system LytT family response regulator